MGTMKKEKVIKRRMMDFAKNFRVCQALLLILAVTFLAFFPCLKNGFVNWDDNLYIRDNPVVRSLTAENVHKVFTSSLVANYQPLTFLSYMLDTHLFGGGPSGYHATNLFWHLINSLLVFWLIFLLSGRVSTAFLTGLLFGIHPLHVESVAWISGRKDVLYVFFYLAALLCYWYYLKGLLRRRFYYGVLALFLLSLLSKTMAVTLPLVLLLMDYFFSKRSVKEALLDKIPFFVLSLVFGGITFFAQGAAGAVRHQEMFDLWGKIQVVPFVMVFYLAKIAWPHALSCLYPYFILPVGFGITLVLAAFIVVGIGVFLFLWRKRSKTVIFCGLFFLVTILPALQFVPIGHTLVADRYVYLSLLGILYGFSAGVSYLLDRFVKAGNRRGIVVIALLLAGLVAALGVTTWTRCGVWKDSVTLWNDVLAKYPRSATAHNNLGVILAEKGRKDEAAVLFQKAVEEDPHYSGAYNNLGMVTYDAGRSAEAAALFRKAVEIDPRSAGAYNNLCKVTVSLGKGEEAIVACERAIELDPQEVGPYNNLGSLLFQRGYRREALLLLQKALEIDPASAQTINNLGVMHGLMGQKEEAARYFNKALAIQPNFADAANNLSFSSRSN
jgi:Flp pilus assembly protein TadD